MEKFHRLQAESAECRRKIAAIRKKARHDIARYDRRITAITRLLTVKTTATRRVIARRRSRVSLIRFRAYRQVQVQARHAASKALRLYYSPKGLSGA